MRCRSRNEDASNSRATDDISVFAWLVKVWLASVFHWSLTNNMLCIQHWLCRCVVFDSREQQVATHHACFWRSVQHWQFMECLYYSSTSRVKTCGSCDVCKQIVTGMSLYFDPVYCCLSGNGEHFTYSITNLMCQVCVSSNTLRMVDLTKQTTWTWEYFHLRKYI